MSRMQQRKGKAFENQVANLIGSTLGEWLTRNLRQYGKNAGRDLLTWLPFCFQCQHAKRIDPYRKLKEARESALDGEMPVAILRRDRQRIIAVMDLDDWLALVQSVLHVEK